MEKVKTDNQVWVRWFYVANWSEKPQALPRENLTEGIRGAFSFFGPEFWEKATFAVYDGNTYREIPAKDIGRGE